MNPELLIIGLNPGSEGKYNEQKTNDKWEFKDGKMTIERLLKRQSFY